MSEASATVSVDWPALLIGLFGGLALFLYGLDKMTVAMKAVAGDRLRLLISRLTVNRFAGVATGAFVTAVIQSSSVTTVLVVSFISSGVMSLSQSVGVILGANIGTTITAQLVAFKVTKMALLLVAGGFGLGFSSRQETLRQHGDGIFGLGLVFLGMTVMSEAMQPLRGYPPFIAVMLQMEAPILGILASAAFTALVQSSSATTGVVISMATQGLITLPAGIALMLGANVGTCVTAFLAAIGKPEDALRAAWAHVLFNIIGVLVWLGLVEQLAQVVTFLSPSAQGLSEMDRLARETPRQIANAHTLFNVANTILFLPFTRVLAAVAERLVPDRPFSRLHGVELEFLDDALLTTPTLALDQVRRELCHLGSLVLEMLVAILPAMTEGRAVDLDRIKRMDEPVDRLYDRIVEYLGQISRAELSSRETDRVLDLMSVANSLESIGDLIETDLVSRGRQRLASDVRISDATRSVIRSFHREVEQALRAVLDALEQERRDLALAVNATKPKIQDLAQQAALHEAERLVADERNRLTAYAVETDMIEDLRRVFYFTRRVAKTVARLSKTAESGSESLP